MQFTEIEKQFFREVWEQDSKKHLFKRYEFTEPWRYVLKIRPNMIDRIRIKDALLESEIKVLDNYLEKNDLRKKQCRLVYGHYKYRQCKKNEKYNEVSEFKNRSLIQILNSIQSE